MGSRAVPIHHRDLILVIEQDLLSVRRPPWLSVKSIKSRGRYVVAPTPVGVHDEYLKTGATTTLIGDLFAVGGPRGILVRWPEGEPPDIAPIRVHDINA
jgi:hypothetical protein